MKIRADYHFHPNLPKSDEKASKKCSVYWDNFKKKGINCVVCTEHAYNYPKRAYDFMKKGQPVGCFCYPGMEYITKEGIDIVIFSLSDNIFCYTELKPFKLTYFEVIDFVNSKEDLMAYVTHPYSLGLSAVRRKLGIEAYLKSLSLLNAVEISNAAFDNIYSLMNKFPFKYFFKSRLDRMLKTKRLPKADYPKNPKFLAVGSDAHHVERVGNYSEMECACDLDDKSVFKVISTCQGEMSCEVPRKFSLRLLFWAVVVTFKEFVMKIKARRKG